MSSALIQKLWNYCSVLRDDGMSYGDYVEQLTYLLFLKMADERSRPPYNQASLIPAKYAWPSLVARDGDDLFEGCANPNCGTVGGNIGATRARNGNLCDGRLAGGGKDFDAIHGAIGNEEMFVRGVVSNVAMVRLAERIVGG